MASSINRLYLLFGLLLLSLDLFTFHTIVVIAIISHIKSLICSIWESLWLSGLSPHFEFGVSISRLLYYCHSRTCIHIDTFIGFRIADDRRLSIGRISLGVVLLIDKGFFLDWSLFKHLIQSLHLFFGYFLPVLKIDQIALNWAEIGN